MNIDVHWNDNCPKSKMCWDEYCKNVIKKINTKYLLNLKILSIKKACMPNIKKPTNLTLKGLFQKNQIGI